MVKLIKSFRLDEYEAKFLEKLAQQYQTSEAEVLRTILSIFMKDAVKQEELEEELKLIAMKNIEKKALKEIRDEGKALQRKATFRVRMIKFYQKLIEAGVRWDEFKDTFISWYNEAKFLGIDEKVVKSAIEDIARLYYELRKDIDLEQGIKEVYSMFLQEVKG